MKTIIVDDEPFAAEYLAQVCMEIPELQVVGEFGSTEKALAYLQGHEVDLALLDIEMPGMNGLEAVVAMRRINPSLGVIFVTGYEHYALEAFQADAVGYLLKPCSVAELRHAAERAALLWKPAAPRLRIVTFGWFAVFIDGQPYRFSNNKAKELLALAVDRKGGVVHIEEAVDRLWEGRAYDDTVKQLYRKAISYLKQMEDQFQLGFFVAQRGTCYIVPSKAECDYFQLLDQGPDAVRFGGEYLLDYSWGEETLARIERMLQI